MEFRHDNTRLSPHASMSPFGGINQSKGSNTVIVVNHLILILNDKQLEKISAAVE